MEWKYVNESLCEKKEEWGNNGSVVERWKSKRRKG